MGDSVRVSLPNKQRMGAYAQCPPSDSMVKKGCGKGSSTRSLLPSIACSLESQHGATACDMAQVAS